MWHPSGCVIDLNSDTTIGIEELGALRPGCWHNGFKRPVLKHGPRSLTCPRVFGCQTRARNESVCWDPKDGELCLNRVKPEETLVEARSDSDVQIDRRIWV